MSDLPEFKFFTTRLKAKEYDVSFHVICHNGNLTFI